LGIGPAETLSAFLQQSNWPQAIKSVSTSATRWP